MGTYWFCLSLGLFLLAMLSFSFLSRRAVSHYERRRHYRLHFWLMLPFASFLVLSGIYGVVVARRFSDLLWVLVGFSFAFGAALHAFVRGPTEKVLVQLLGPHHCAECGYDLKGNASGVCPECGTMLFGPPHTPPEAKPSEGPSSSVGSPSGKQDLPTVKQEE